MHAHDASRAERNGRPPRRVPRAIGDHRDVRAEQLPVRPQHALEVRRARLLVSLEQELQARPGL